MIIKIVAAIFLTVSHGSLWAADWKKVGGTERADFYADVSSISRTGAVAKMWTLRDYKTPQTDETGKFLSSKDLVELDCKDVNRRIVYSSFHSKNMGDGVTLGSTTTASPWAPISPESISELMLKIACK